MVFDFNDFKFGFLGLIFEYFFRKKLGFLIFKLMNFLGCFVLVRLLFWIFINDVNENIVFFLLGIFVFGIKWDDVKVVLLKKILLSLGILFGFGNWFWFIIILFCFIVLVGYI